MTGSAAYTVFWLYRAERDWRTRPEPERARARDEFVALLEGRDRAVSLRGTYSTVGLCADVDLILWLVSTDLDALQGLGAAINRSALGASLELRHAYLGLTTPSQYDPEHGAAFAKGISPAKYLSVYPFTKTPEWYLLSYEERRDLMKVHGDLGREFPTILTNTVSSFGIADQEFIVALEDDDPAVLVAMVQRLRGAAVRLYTKVDTPIFLGRLKDPAAALADLG